MFNTWERCEYSAITLLERGCVAEKKGNGKYANQQKKAITNSVGKFRTSQLQYFFLVL